jgi:arylsulfatase A-like enzyme
MPGVALITIIWSSVAVITALLLWLIVRPADLFFHRINWQISADNVLINICLLMFLSIFMWFGKHAIYQDMPTPRILKISIVLSIVLISFVVSWLFRKKMSIIQERITPLVWVYGIILILSIPLLVYHMGKNNEYDDIPEKLRKTLLADINRPNIILVTFDALTARNMSVYGYNRETTPFISEWAKNAYTFTKAQAESTYTAPTIASLMTGKRVWTHQLYQPHGYKIINANKENLPLVLKNNGYYNIALIQNIYASVDTLGITKSYDIVYPVNEFVTFNSIAGFIDVTLYKYFAKNIILYDWATRLDFIFGNLVNAIGRFLDIAGKEYPLEKVFDKLLWLIKHKLPKPFFAWIHIMPPHDPYLPPEPYIGMFDPSSKLRTFKSQTMKNKYANIDTTRARYDEFIRYCDKEFENFINGLSKHVTNTAIILSSDHGEMFKHTHIGHGGSHLYEHLTNIPLIIKEADQSEGRIIDDLVEQIDIAPTILKLANIPVSSWMEGKSLIPLMRGQELPVKPILSMSLWCTPNGQVITDGTFAVWEGNYKLIYYLKNNKSLLFNLRGDQNEMINLFDREPEVGKHLLTVIQDNLEDANKRVDIGKQHL